METKLSKVLDECVARISNSRTIETCLAEYPTMHEQLEPLLYTALSISAIPRVSPSDEFIRASKIRLMARLRIESIQAEVRKTDSMAGVWRGLWHGIKDARKVALPVTLSVLCALGAILVLARPFNLLSPPSALASQCTLSLLSSGVEVQSPGSNTWQEGIDSMVLEAGTRVRTAPDSYAILTFFEGSTIKLEPGTNLEIQRVEYAEAQPTTIVLKQWLGRTWSRVVKMADPGSHYEIHTPLASAVVRGTLFTTETKIHLW